MGPTCQQILPDSHPETTGAHCPTNTTGTILSISRQQSYPRSIIHPIPNKMKITKMDASKQQAWTVLLESHLRSPKDGCRHKIKSIHPPPEQDLKELLFTTMNQETSASYLSVLRNKAELKRKLKTKEDHTNMAKSIIDDALHASSFQHPPTAPARSNQQARPKLVEIPETVKTLTEAETELP